MTTPPATPRARRAAVPGALAARDDLTGAHYASAFALPVPRAGALTAEQWVRAVFEGTPAPLRRFLVLGWTLGLGLRLGPRTSPRHVLGWAVSDAADHSLTLTARSSLVLTHNVVAVEDARVLWATFVRFDRPVGRPLWALAAPVHHRPVPRLLRRAARDAASAGETTPGDGRSP
ncbi:DUF2867 domain-containing protein [Streptomyces violaceusniger]|uniref:DUF2867 domain-containing protein n=1 Tax=Streptomyces violaceusniger (strain Tu 4113) TaxID=653045 RepID=G2P404_STRV4|nr:DUF2867 domain-containing protein [Streptomyces violaceusniger]AEM84713.1 hypothetical protein Strvi_5177 [Streptomyces violaceusniger Tu 4113]